MRYKVSILIVLCIAVITGYTYFRYNTSRKNEPPQEQIELSDNNENNTAENELEHEKTVDKANGKIAYLTIDDGPSQDITPMILDILKEKGVKATFFVLPHEDMDSVYERILLEGHVIGNHSYSHSNTIYTSENLFTEDLLKAKNYIQQKLNYTTKLYRFPGGAMGRKNEVVSRRAEVLKKNGYVYFDWNVSTADTDPKLASYGDEKQIVDTIVNNVIKTTNGRKKIIVLMHDSKGKIYTAKALPLIIDGLKNQGYSFDVLTNYRENVDLSQL